MLNGKCEAFFWAKKKPTKIQWTVFARRLHKKGSAEEISKRKSRKTVKIQRAVVGATWEDILAKRNQPENVRKAARDVAVEEAKKKKKIDEDKKRADKIKTAALQRNQQQKVKAPQASKTSRARY